MHKWQLQDAKAKLSEVVKSSEEEGPQEITVRGRPAAVVLSVTDYKRLRHPKPGFVEFIRNSPLAGSGIVVMRDRSRTRPVKL
jgi:antitoxin Phd